MIEIDTDAGDGPDDDDEPPNDRSTLWAMVCDVLVPGLGHWYLGAIRQAVAIAAIFVLAIPALVVAIVAVDRGLTLAVWATLGSASLLRALAAAHAAIVAKRRERFEPTKFHTLGGYLAFIVVVAGLGELAARTSRERVLETLVVPADSGQPNIDTGDHIVVTKLTARDRAGERGDLVTFVVPGNTAIFVKRVVAVGGETISIADGVVSIDGLPLATSPCQAADGLALAGGATCLVEHTPEGVAYPIQFTGPGGALAPTLVPPGSVFVLGDNRVASHDSRAFGPVSLDAVTGRARAIYLPFTRTASLDPAKPPL